MALEEKITQALNDSENFSKKVALAFFKTLKRSGCSDQQIISVAKDVIGCLIESLNKFEQKKTKIEKVKRIQEKVS